jgi:hypothetical protein
MVRILTVCWMLSCTSCLETTEVLSARGFTHVPKNLSVIVVTLDLSRNNITEIKIDDFRTLKRVETIYLSYNQIQTLHERSFEHVYCLQELDLSYNNIVHLPHSIFSNNHNLKKLYLKKNSLQFLGDLSKAQHILDSKSLIYLDLSFCNISYISHESLKGLPNLKTLKTDGNPCKQQNVEIKNPPKNTRTMKTDFGNSSTFEKFCCNLQERSVENTSTAVSPQTKANGKEEDSFVVIVASILCAVVFITVVTLYVVINIYKNRKANMVAIRIQNSVNAIQNRPLPLPPSQDTEYEVPILCSNECISSATSNNLQSKRNFGYVRLPSAESESLINANTATYNLSMGKNHGSVHSLSVSTEYQDNLLYPPNICIYSYSDVIEEEENNLSLPPMKGDYSISTTPHFSGTNRPSATGTQVRPHQKLGRLQVDGYLEKKRVPTRPTPTYPASPTKNVTTFCVKNVDSQKVYVSSISIDVGHRS